MLIVVAWQPCDQNTRTGQPDLAFALASAL
jgi:hypothetical protein